MTSRNTILQELRGLESALANHNPQNIYSVPNGYFEGLATQILNRVRNNADVNARSETKNISVLVDDISRETPYRVPDGYFDLLPEKLMSLIRSHADYQTSKEELSALSPLLDSISKKTPYHVPEGYFESLEPGNQKKETKVVTLTAWRKWTRYASAAVMAGVVAVSALLIMKPNVIDPNENPQAWVKKNVTKKIDSEKLDAFVKLSAEDQNLKQGVPASAVNTDEIRELMKDVSEKEIQEFLNETVALESNDTDDIFLN